MGTPITRERIDEARKVLGDREDQRPIDALMQHFGISKARAFRLWRATEQATATEDIGKNDVQRRRDWER